MNSSILKIRDYQQKAIDAWVSNGYIGFFEMATGTGKTITALYCAKYLLNLESKIILLVLVPTLDLALQWKDSVKNIVCPNIILANSKSPDWYQETVNALQGQGSFCIITTYSTFLSGRFQYIVGKLPNETMIIADEAHNFGTDLHLKLYPQKITRRLGLSATPIRHFDEEGTHAIMAYFGATSSPTFQFNMAKAIKEKYLCEYYYYPIIVSLTDTELAEYKLISKKLAKYFSQEGNFKTSPILTMLLLKRKRIIHNAFEKFDALRRIFEELVNQKKELKYILVYVPEGNDKDEEAVNRKLIDEYSRIISVEFGIDQHQFIGLTTSRSIILEQFAAGKIAVLTAMKCLDEGVDIKRAETAIFCASTGNPRQFIQRRGRILRTHPNKNFAVIYDMIVVPSIGDGDFDKSLEMEKSILQGELGRVYEFASLSLNKYQALQSLESIAKNFEIDIYSVDQ